MWESEWPVFKVSDFTPSVTVASLGTVELDCFVFIDVTGWTTETVTARCLAAVSATLFFIADSSSDLDSESC